MPKTVVMRRGIYYIDYILYRRGKGIKVSQSKWKEITLANSGETGQIRQNSTRGKGINMHTSVRGLVSALKESTAQLRDKTNTPD